MTVREEKITLEPMDVFWGRRQRDSIEFVDDVASSEAGSFFTIGTADYFWLDNSIIADPAPVGFANSHAIVYAPGASASTIAVLAEAVVDAVTNMNAKATVSTLVYEENAQGVVVGLVDGDTGYVITSVAVGDGRDLGGTGPIELSFSSDLTDITAAQLGTQILDQVVTATNLEIGFDLMELTPENWKLMLAEVIGGTETVSGSELIGLGDSKRFKNMSQFARELKLKPVGSTDDERNIHLWKVYPVIDNVNYAGDDVSKMSLSWRALRDSSKPNTLNLMTFGDGTLNLL